MSAHFASVLVPANRVPDILRVADLAGAALPALIDVEGEDSPLVANLQAAVAGIRREAKASAGDAAVDRAQLTLLVGTAAKRASVFDDRAAVMAAEACL